MAPAKTQSVDSYIATFPRDVQEVLTQIREIIRQAAPAAQETISYSMPAFKLRSKYWIYFAGWRAHVSLYPIPTGPASFRRAIAPYVTGKGTLTFPLNKPIPYDLIRKIVALHVAHAA